MFRPGCLLLDIYFCGLNSFIPSAEWLMRLMAKMKVIAFSILNDEEFVSIGKGIYSIISQVNHDYF
jgi:hypothetical protein